MEKINIIIMNLSVDEAVTENEDGSYTIFINDNLSKDFKEKSYLHALQHIYGNDFENGKNVQQIESIAHGIEEQ